MVHSLAKASLLGKYLSIFGEVRQRIKFWRSAADKLDPELKCQGLAVSNRRLFTVWEALFMLSIRRWIGG